MQKKLTERQKRQNVVYQFELLASKFNLEIKARQANYKFLLLDKYTGKELVAMALASSFDFYEYRLNRAARRVDLLIVQRHNAVVPVGVLEIMTGIEFDAGAMPEIEREQVKKRNHEEVNLFVSKLLTGYEGAQEELERMPERTQQRYIALRDAYLLPRVGRPWAS